MSPKYPRSRDLKLAYEYVVVIISLYVPAWTSCCCVELNQDQGARQNYYQVPGTRYEPGINTRSYNSTINMSIFNTSTSIYVQVLHVPRSQYEDSGVGQALGHPRCKQAELEQTHSVPPDRTSLNRCAR